MIFLIDIADLSLPFTNPVIKFFIILTIILIAPLIMNKIKIPPLLGLIIAGAIIGPNGFNLMTRDSGIILSGTAGLLYIMFLAGLEIDLAEFKRNSRKSMLFGSLTFLIPMSLGILSSLYFLNYSIITSILLASMYASHTLIAYPLISKLGAAKNRAVNITVGGTMITDTLALLVLAVIVEATSGSLNTTFWIRLAISIIIFGLIVMILFPIIGRWFFKHFEDSSSQYIFVLAMVFLGAVLAEFAGIEAIIGAFLAGLAMNRLIPKTSPLMNRVDFVGNAIFIPFFLIGVGMLINYRAFFEDIETLKVAAVMTVIATVSKYLAALSTQKLLNYTTDERKLIFGLSNAQAAATLAAVLIGYNVILGETENGEPIRLLNDSVLNGTIIMILITCTIASFVAQKGAQAVVLQNSSEDEKKNDPDERILIPISNPETIEELIRLSIIIKSPVNTSELYVMNIVNSENNNKDEEKLAMKMLEKAVSVASSADIELKTVLRYDLNIINGITNTAKENNVTDIILGLHIKKAISDSFLGSLTEGILSKCDTTTIVYKPTQPISTIKRHLVVISKKAEQEIGFHLWLGKIWNISKNTGAKILFYAPESTLYLIKQVNEKRPIEAEFIPFDNLDDFLVISRDIKVNDNLIIVKSRRNKPSYHPAMEKIPVYLNKYFQTYSCIIIYPIQSGFMYTYDINLMNPSVLDPFERLNEAKKTLSDLFKKS